MSASLGRVMAQLAEPVEERLKELVNLINDNINPPEMVTEADVNIRAMYIVSDEVNGFGGRFPSEELERLVELLIDSPVMVGHRKDKLPIGRNFHAVIVNRNGKKWIKSYFYWLRSAEGAGHLKENIDGGIYKECSIGFTFLFPECSICNKDVRTCQHEPFEKYSVGNEKKLCYFNYRQLERVLETSLVYRGAVPDTMVSKELGISKNNAKKKETLIKKINHPRELDAGKKYLVTPFYEAVEVLASCQNSILTLTDINGNSIDDEITRILSTNKLPEMLNVYGHLVGYRGKERCSIPMLKKYLISKKGLVTRLELKLFPRDSLDLSLLLRPESMDKIKVIRHQFTDVENLDSYAKKLMTRKGVRIWRNDQLPPHSTGYIYCPDSSSKETSNSYTIISFKDNTNALLRFNDNGNKEQFEIKQYNLARLLKGGRFIADPVTKEFPERNVENAKEIKGILLESYKKDESIILECEGGLKGRFVLQPFKINGLDRYLFFRWKCRCS